MESEKLMGGRSLLEEIVNSLGEMTGLVIVPYLTVLIFFKCQSINPSFGYPPTGIDFKDLTG